MAKQLNVPIAGIVENMSYMKCPHCGDVIKMFEDSNVESVTKVLNLPFLGKLPFDPEVNRLADKGKIEHYSSREISELVRKVKTEVLHLGGITAKPIAWKRSSN